MEIGECKFLYIYLDQTRSSCEKCNYSSSGRNQTCDSAISMQRSNQLTYILKPVVELKPQVDACKLPRWSHGNAYGYKIILGMSLDWTNVGGFCR